MYTHPDAPDSLINAELMYACFTDEEAERLYPEVFALSPPSHTRCVEEALGWEAFVEEVTRLTNEPNYLGDDAWLDCILADTSLADLKDLMVRLVNEERLAAGVPPVRLGSNRAAQVHAEAALEWCYVGHWDRWGLQPNHRYTMAGGTGSDRENVSGRSYCYTAADIVQPIWSLEEEVAEAIAGWMDSPGHRRTILRPESTILHVGIAYDHFNSLMVQQFSSDYVTYTHRPNIDSAGVLSLLGSVSGATTGLDWFSPVTITYSPPPHPLTRGQLLATHRGCVPPKVAHLLKPGSDIVTESATHEIGCVDPYRVPSNRQTPSSSEEAAASRAAAEAASNAAGRETITYKGIPSERMDFTVTSFDIAADLSAILDEHGPGIYHVLLWGVPDHMQDVAVLSKQSIWWGIEPPADAPYYWESPLR